MRRLLPLTAPPTGSLAALVAIIVFVDLLYGFGHWWFVRQFPFTEPLEWAAYQTLNAIICVFFAAFYGGYRVFAFHPVFRRSYYDWLMTTPWTRQQTLPLGPVHLTGWETPFVGLATLLAAGPDRLRIVGVPIAFLVAYGLALLACQVLCRQRWVAYGMLAGLGFLVQAMVLACAHPTRLSGSPIALEWALIPVAAVGALGMWGVHRSLALPSTWMVVPNLNAANSAQAQSDAAWSTSDIGWPFDRIGPKPQPDHANQPFAAGWPLTRGDELAMAGLAGWLLYSLSSPFTPHKAEDGLNVATAAAVASPLLMLIFALVSYRPPISWWGRLWTGRLIIPGYDRVFLWPLVTAIVQAAQFYFTLGATLTHGKCVPVSVLVALTVWCWLRASAAFQHFQYTGHHAITRSAVTGSKRIAA